MYEHPVSEITSPAEVDYFFDVLAAEDVRYVNSLSLTGEATGVASITVTGGIESVSFTVWFDFSPETGKVFSWFGGVRKSEEYVVKHMQSALFYLLGEEKETWVPALSPRDRALLNEVGERIARKVQERGFVSGVKDDIRRHTSLCPGDFVKLAGKPQEGLVCYALQGADVFFHASDGWKMKRASELGVEWYLCFNPEI